jgi:hypothetical protein
MTTQGHGECGIASLLFIAMFVKEYGQINEENLIKFAKDYAGKIFTPEEIDFGRRKLLYFPAVQMIILDVEKNTSEDDIVKKNESFKRLQKTFSTQSFDGGLEIFKKSK